MDDNSQKAYNEVNKILSFIEQQYIDKIPNRLLEILKNGEVKGYEPEIQIDKPLTEQNLQQRTFDFLAMLHLNYWCESEEEKQELLSIYAENDKREEKELREKYNPDNLFKGKEKKEQKLQELTDVEQSDKQNNLNNQEKNTSLVAKKEHNFITRILEKIKSFLKK